jgi:hypothetical protein
MVRFERPEIFPASGNEVMFIFAMVDGLLNPSQTAPYRTLPDDVGKCPTFIPLGSFEAAEFVVNR